jgi:Holliday junction resolvase RusA-like endonuclease
VTFYLKIPRKSKNVTQKLEGRYHIQRPDLDNLAKFVFEVAQMRDDEDRPLLINDDSFISKIIASKIYSVEPKTVFTITELK